MIRFIEIVFVYNIADIIVCLIVSASDFQLMQISCLDQNQITDVFKTELMYYDTIFLGMVKQSSIIVLDRFSLFIKPHNFTVFSI